MPSKAPLVFPSESKLLTDLGERMRLARLRRRLTTSTVAERCGISRPTLAKVERGDPSVTFGTYLRVLAVYGLEGDLSAIAADDKLGRRLQDLALPAPRKGSR
ncbi:MAG: helix-turn-helix transcriptional regulator [Rhodocyclaceae bacterium]|nr:helix-turn-helix transcriptional regulator [Rhodocyclaceae bacterium]